MVRTHRDLEIWKTGIELVEKIYKGISGFLMKEIYDITSQMRRAAVSIPSNIAEGVARNSGKEFTHFLYINLGSLSELETQVIIANKIGYLDSLDMINSIEILRKKLLNFIEYVKTKIK